MAKKIKTAGKMDVHVRLDEKLSGFLRRLTEKTYRSFNQEIQSIIREKADNEKV